MNSAKVIGPFPILEETFPATIWMIVVPLLSSDRVPSETLDEDLGVQPACIHDPHPDPVRSESEKVTPNGCGGVFVVV